jgi:sucrose-6-phosphate hydrolase SacC (GH32 family)
MSNWQYGQDVPTAPWRSAMTIPRELGLRRTREGIRLTQKPVRELESLRDHGFAIKDVDTATANTWLRTNQIQGDQLELSVSFGPASEGEQGLRVLTGANEETVIGVDRAHGRVFVDRTKSGLVSFSPNFPGAQDAPLVAADAPVKLHVFVDACSVEVFVNDGERVLTDLVYPSPESRGVELMSSNGGMKVRALEIWKLKSVWR